jgi:NDP-4-keto-2,6-dideoxyhexose 3-C-methyltransferase
MCHEIKQCRICGNNDLWPVLNIGTQFLTGVFPRNIDQQITAGPLELVRCVGDKNGTCGLVQLKHSFDLGEMYGDNYGYRSGLNNSMVKHLYEKVHNIINIANLTKDDLIIDIGSNDSTLLQAYGDKGYHLVGIDPTGNKFKEYYPPHINLIADFFSKKLVNRYYGNKKAKIVTSIAMFYDLESPIDFAQQVYDVLADDGMWFIEQSYLPVMMEKNAYDTICHEHLEYYSLRQIQWICNKVGLKIIDIEENSINGGSFSLMLAKSNSYYNENKATIKKFKDREQYLNKDETYLKFNTQVFEHRERLIEFIREKNDNNKLILGYGASTKGNVIFQFCKLTKENIPYIAEINEDKFGSFTPGTNIPIISEKKAREMKPDFFMVLPWHFKDNIITKEDEYLKSGGKLVFPLPSIDVI